MVGSANVVTGSSFRTHKYKKPQDSPARNFVPTTIFASSQHFHHWLLGDRCGDRKPMDMLLMPNSIEGATLMNRRKNDQIPFPHPGETIREDYLKPLRMSVNKLALELRVPATRMTEIVHGRRGVTADTALRLARYFNTTPKFWLNLQASYDLALTAAAKAEEIERNVHLREAA